ncbi:hypothetical protein MTO96_043569 [Rhipicephalus appendiculatus]
MAPDSTGSVSRSRGGWGRNKVTGGAVVRRKALSRRRIHSRIARWQKPSDRAQPTSSPMMGSAMLTSS